MKQLLFFKISGCNQCKQQEKILDTNKIPYIPCELFKNRQLARTYGVTDVPTIVIIDENKRLIYSYNFLLNYNIVEKIKKILK